MLADSSLPHRIGLVSFLGYKKLQVDRQYAVFEPVVY